MVRFFRLNGIGIQGHREELGKQCRDFNQSCTYKSLDASDNFFFFFLIIFIIGIKFDHCGL